MTLRHRFVSLGGDCRPVCNIRRLSGGATPLFFDWMVTPLDAIIPLIEMRFSDAFTRSDLAWEEKPHELHVTDTRYGVVSWHQFKSQEDAEVDRMIGGIRWTGRMFLDLLESPEPIVFVRRWHALDEAAGVVEARGVFDYLRKRKSNSVFLYLNPHEGVSAGVEDCFIVSEVEPVVWDPWWGSEAFYDESLTLADRVAEELFGCVTAST